MGSAPLTNAEAWAVSDAITADPRVGAVVAEPSVIPPAWRWYSSLPSSSPKVWMDAYLAAFARASDAVLVAVDGAFQLYPGLESILIPPAPEE